jgi:hypothetical protein
LAEIDSSIDTNKGEGKEFKSGETVNEDILNKNKVEDVKENFEDSMHQHTAEHLKESDLPKYGSKVATIVSHSNTEKEKQETTQDNFSLQQT